MAARAISACSGAGGLDLGLRLAADIRTVCYVERDAYAAACLVARMEDQTLDRAPIWDDLQTFDGRAWHGRVDLIHGGIPCQPFSSAGQRVGVDDPRWLWPAFWAATRAADAPAVLLENVPGFRRDALPLVLDDLAASGWDAEWLMLSAGDVGAPHRRDRFWLFAWDRARRDVVADTYSSALRLEPGRGSGADGSDTAVAGHARQELADTYSRGREVVWEGRPGAGQPPRDNTHRRRPFPPCRHDPDGWADWLDGHPGTEPGVRRGADGLAHRLDRLHKAGNGVVPLVAAVAFTRLIRRAFK